MAPTSQAHIQFITFKEDIQHNKDTFVTLFFSNATRPTQENRIQFIYRLMQRDYSAGTSLFIRVKLFVISVTCHLFLMQ